MTGSWLLAENENMARSYEDLDVWQRAINLAERVYTLTADFPNDERFGLVSQLRRSAVSVASNIAEGSARNTKGEFTQFLGIASGSLAELKTQLIIANRVRFIDDIALACIVEEINISARMLYALRNSMTGQPKKLATSN